jgi:hypothetical protein
MAFQTMVFRKYWDVAIERSRLSEWPLQFRPLLRMKMVYRNAFPNENRLGKRKLANCPNLPEVALILSQSRRRAMPMMTTSKLQVTLRRNPLQKTSKNF